MLTFALVLRLSESRCPWPVVVVGQALLAVVSHGVVGAVALAVDHVTVPEVRYVGLLIVG